MGYRPFENVDGRGRRKFHRPRFVVLSRILSGLLKPGRSFISSGQSRAFRQAECDYYPRALGYPSRKADQLSVLSCTARGLSCDPAHAEPGGLLPRHFTLIPPTRDGIFSVTLSVSSNLRPRCPRFRTACCFPGVRTFLYRTRFGAQQRSPTYPTILGYRGFSASSAGETVPRALASE